MIQQKGNSPHFYIILVPIHPPETFFSKLSLCHISGQDNYYPCFCKKIWKFNDSLEKIPKTSFLGHFGLILVQICPKNSFWENWALSHMRVYVYPLMCKKSEKTTDKSVPKIFFFKIGLRHIWGFMVTHLCAKIFM